MYELIATTTFGLEAVCRREIEQLGYEVTATEDGKVTFLGDERAIARANLWLGTADRVLIKMAEFKAEESDDLFTGVKGIAWEDLIPIDGRVPVSCSTVKSKLRSEPNNQKTVKKAIVDRLRRAYNIPEGDMLPETGALFGVKVTLLKDRATITVDTSGEGLHKRGYRVAPVTAPIKETLAAAMVQLSFWKAGRVLIDPCCGSGTIGIEAALIAKDIAPGFCAGMVDEPVRRFAAEDWDAIPGEVWKEERMRSLGGHDTGPQDMTMLDVDPGEVAGKDSEDAGKPLDSSMPGEDHVDTEARKPLDITLMDVDPRAIEAAKKNAEAACVADDITFKQGDIADVLEEAARGKENGIIITNPPYGERIGDRKQQDHVFKALSDFMEKHHDWSVFLISPDKRTEEKVAGRRADRRRKLYNGNIEVCYYQFHGEKPGK